MERHHSANASFHSSMRSRESSSTAGSDAREKIKDCCRKFIAFMFTQVGVGALVVCYAIFGAAGFMHIEKDSPDQQLKDVRQLRQNCAEELWNVTEILNTFNKTVWVLKVDSVLKGFQNNITAAIHTGYNGRSAEDIWSFPAALMYSLSVFTMIGYGNIVPKTVWGKITTIAYACFGIPIYILYFCNMGKVLAKSFKWLYITAHECSRRDDTVFEDGEVPVKRKITVPSTACLWVISFYILTGTIMFGAWEKWNYLDSTYFCVISLCKIGFGDFVPGANITDSAGGSHLKLVMNFIYVLLGMGLVAMCYNLMCEDVRVKVRELREDLKNCLDDITLKITVLSRPLCFIGVEGLPERYNDVLFKPALPRRWQTSAPPETLVFFGGEGQNFIHLMGDSDPNLPYQRWCLEAASIRLSASFPNHHIVVIKPARTLFDHVCSFDNFVISNFVGSPKHVFHYDCIPHLELILRKISKKIKTMSSHTLFKMLLKKQVDEDFLEDDQVEDIVWKFDLMPARKQLLLRKWQKNLRLHKYPLTMVGFGKGCVVLNQFVYEFHYAKRLEPRNQDSRYIDRIKSMYWLDASHPGRDNVYISSRAPLKTLADLRMDLYSHVSQYQTEDLKRPWIRRQWLEFTETLKEFKAKLTVNVHKMEIADLRAHLNVLLTFKTEKTQNTPLLRPIITPSLSIPSINPPPQSKPQQTHNVPMPRQIIGVGLISPQSDPYLGIQVILREPVETSASAANSQSRDVNPSIQHPPTCTQYPTTSTKRGYRSADSFEVLIKKPSARVNFNEDLAAAEGYRNAQHFRIEAPVIATPSDDLHTPGVSVYAALIETYEPMVINNYFGTETASPELGLVDPIELELGAAELPVPPQPAESPALSQPIALQAEPVAAIASQSPALPQPIAMQAEPVAAIASQSPALPQPIAMQAEPVDTIASQSSALSQAIAMQAEPVDTIASQSSALSQAIALQAEPVAAIASAIPDLSQPIALQAESAQNNLPPSPDDEATPPIIRRSRRSLNRNTPYSRNDRSSSSNYNLRSLR